MVQDAAAVHVAMTSGSDPTITNCDGRQEAFEVSWQENRGSGPWSGWHPASVCPSAITT